MRTYARSDGTNQKHLKIVVCDGRISGKDSHEWPALCYDRFGWYHYLKYVPGILSVFGITSSFQH